MKQELPSEQNGTWLRSWIDQNGRSLRVLHIGNIANNAYNNAKVQRQRGIDADVLCHDYYHIMGCPEWEDADFTGDPGDPFSPNWTNCNLNGFQRPKWFAQGPFDLCADYLINKSTGKSEKVDRHWAFLSFYSKLHDGTPKGLHPKKHVLIQRAKNLLKLFLPPIVIILIRRMLLVRARFILAIPKTNDYDSTLKIIKILTSKYRKFFQNRADNLTVEDCIPWAANIQKWKKLFDHYDVIQAYATFPILPILCGKRNFAAYEHGTIREIPFEANSQGRICAIGYKLAPVVFVTNSDNLAAAEKLNLSKKQVYCLPHAFDNEKLFRFRQENEDRFYPPTDKVVFFSPARQHWKDKDPSMAKCNDQIFHAVRELSNESYTFIVKLVEWGRDVQHSKQLIQELGIEEYIQWVPTMKKRELWQKYMSVHAVIDQLLLPALGGVGFEAMALGRRLLTAMDMELSEKFFGASPVLFNVHDVQSLTKAMRSVLEDPEDHAGIGNDASEWIRRYHSADRICQIQTEAYQKIVLK